MALKDYLRLIRRRWFLATCTSLLSVVIFFSYAAMTDRPMYKARTRCYVDIPDVLTSASQGLPRNTVVSLKLLNLSTWPALIRSRQVTEGARKILQERSSAAASHPLEGIAANWEEGTQIMGIEAAAPSPESAAEAANAMAESASRLSASFAVENLSKLVQNAEAFREEEWKLHLAPAEAESARLRDRARIDHRVDDLEIETRRIQEEVLSFDSRKRDLMRKMEVNRLRLSRIRTDRFAAEHARREAIPIFTASAESRVSENPRVRTLEARIEDLQRQKQAQEHRYTPEHPGLVALIQDIRRAELDLTQARHDALGKDMDAEELAIRTDKDLLDLEYRVLDSDVSELKARLEHLLPLAGQLQQSERAVADGKAKMASLDTLLTQLRTAPGTGAYFRTIEPAQAADAVRIEMRLQKSWPMAILVGLILGIGMAFMADMLDTTLRTDYDIKRHLDYPVLTVVPRVPEDEVLTVHSSRAGFLVEIYDTLATVLLSAPSSAPSRVYLVTSTNPREGKTTLSINLATAMARQGRRTVIIDGDMRIPGLHSLLGVPNGPGLAELLAGRIEGTMNQVLHDAPVPNLKVLTSGLARNNPYELLDLSRLQPVLATLRQQGEAIIIDSPPVLQTGDALKISSVVDGVIFVVEAGRTDQRQATWAKRLLENVGAKVVGGVLNKAAIESDQYYYYYSYRNYYKKESRQA